MAEVTEPVVVIGGGIAGLSAAWQLQRDGMPVRLFESEDVVGGKIRTSDFGGVAVDEAADAFLARVPDGVELARDLGIAGQLIAPSARRAQVWSDGLHPLPEPNVLGIPLDRDAAERLLGSDAADAIDADLARTAPDPVRPNDTIGSLVRRRLGHRIHESLVDPLIGAINAGDTDELSLAASSPQIHAAAEAGPSLVASLQRQAAARRSDAPVFQSFPGGMSTMVDALASKLGDVVTTGCPVAAIRPPTDGGPITIELAGGPELAATAVIVATPAPTAAGLLGEWSNAATALRAIPFVSVALVTLAYPRGTIGQPREFSGFVVPRSDPALTITACSYASQKWPHLGDDPELLRVSVGHGNDQTTPRLPEAQLLEVVRRDLATALGIECEPVRHRISRGPDAFPQYVVGHLDRLAMVEGQLNPDGVFLAGMSYRGIGIPANIDQGRTAAVSAILHVLDTPEHG